MSLSTAETTDDRQRVSTPDAGTPPRADFSVVLALTVAVALGAFLVAAPLARLIIPGTDLPDPFPDQNQDAETLLFLLAFAVILPLAVRYVPRVADRIAAGPDRAALPAIVAVLCAGLLAMLVAVKVSHQLPWGGGPVVLLVAMLVWFALAAAVLYRAAAPGSSASLGRLAGMAEPIWWVTGTLLLGAILAFSILDSVSAIPLGVGLCVALAIVALYRSVELPRIEGPWGFALDLAVAGIVFLAVPNLVILRPEDPSASFETTILHFHQNFFLGPASHVLGGGAMLVDTLSQYGVASIDFIAGWFALVGIGNGMLGLLDGLLSGLVFAGGYFVIRAAGVSRLLAATAMAIGVVALVDGLVYPIGGLLQHGAIRFGMPMAVLVASATELRYIRLALPARVGIALTVGLSSIWALEAFAYTTLTFAGILAARAALLPKGGRVSFLLRRVGEAALACVVAHVAFAVITLLASGELPDWGLYINTLRAFLTGTVGDLTYDFSSWSPGIAVGAIYVSSGAGVALLLKRHRALAERESVAVVLLAGTTAYGIALLSYLVNRSADHIIPYVSLPALMVSVIWLSLLLRSPATVSLRGRSAALGVALGVSALLVAVAWSSAGERFSQSALAYAPPGGKSLGDAVDRLSNLPPLSKGAAEAEVLLDRFWPGQDQSLVIVEPDLGVEALARTGRINVLPLSDPWEDSLVPYERFDDLDATLSELEGGDRLLLDEGAIGSFKQYERDPSLDPLSFDPNVTLVPSGLTGLQEYSLRKISLRFDLRILARSEAATPGGEDPGLSVAELVPISGAG